MRSRYLISLITAAAMAAPATTFAADGHAHGSHGAGHMQHASAEAAIQGKGILKALKGGTVTLSHQAIPALKWPAMTMDFTLEDPALTNGLKVGDAVAFELKPTGNSYVISAMKAE